MYKDVFYYSVFYLFGILMPFALNGKEFYKGINFRNLTSFVVSLAAIGLFLLSTCLLQLVTSFRQRKYKS